MTWAESLKLEGRQEGKFIGQIVTYCELLGMPELAEEELAGMSLAELQEAVKTLKAEARQRLK